uniref:Uncharacterized protein n=1 Tax=Cucumis sativus TaxID=3659 RepID=A0A0A0KNU0_CUCSA
MLPGPLSNLYCSMDSLNTINYFEPKRRLQNLLNPKTYYLCNNNYRKQSSCHSVSSTHGTKCPNCGGYMTINLAYVYVDEEEKLIEGGYVTGMGKYMVMDDLTVKPMAYSSMSTISVLNELNVDDISQIEDKLIRLDIKEGSNLLKASFHTSTVLTEVFLLQTRDSIPTNKQLEEEEEEEEEEGGGGGVVYGFSNKTSI